MTTEAHLTHFIHFLILPQTDDRQQPERRPFPNGETFDLSGASAKVQADL